MSAGTDQSKKNAIVALEKFLGDRLSAELREERPSGTARSPEARAQRREYEEKIVEAASACARCAGWTSAAGFLPLEQTVGCMVALALTSSFMDLSGSRTDPRHTR